LRPASASLAATVPPPAPDPTTMYSQSAKTGLPFTIAGIRLSGLSSIFICLAEIIRQILQKGARCREHGQAREN
jgi:hypothetical protein